MISIKLNIVANILLLIIMFYSAREHEKNLHYKKESYAKLKLLSSLLLMFWALFMVFYLIIDYDNILAGPLNVRLNFYETIKSYLFPLYLGCGLILSKKVKS